MRTRRHIVRMANATHVQTIEFCRSSVSSAAEQRGGGMGAHIDEHLSRCGIRVFPMACHVSPSDGSQRRR